MPRSSKSVSFDDNVDTSVFMMMGSIVFMGILQPLYVKRVRKAQQLSQEELGLRINADQAYISRIEAGTLNPTLESIAEIAVSLKVPISELLKR